ncbi:hypothetical protein GGTG_05270 [Gaeumannomyces tritici R3-111a-1]|uniref:Uncharacterized protein n=1 Tax=Gaeumannomyces tritici (strain R3-111a-1) TaxID=644352 RepID=J3NVF5_GAET3|nr:hypothetical protein GGTG_05270 [Gaeumannomyces tritici R3-111a-1]EJT75333.1 hypothetical protein GGTG_05270 [Gaeumannomyces tritici R3-111a-1]
MLINGFKKNLDNKISRFFLTNALFAALYAFHAICNLFLIKARCKRFAFLRKLLNFYI